MDIDTNIELQRETIFKDAVLSQAEAKGMEIIATAGKNRSHELEEAYAHCEEASYSVIKQRLARKAGSGMEEGTQKARQELLRLRGTLVDEIFDGVRKNLVEFAKSDGYGEHLKALLARHTDDLAGREDVTVTLRRQDEAFEEDIRAQLPGAAIEFSDRIQLGGLWVSAGNILFDESLDAALEQQRADFTLNSTLSL